MSIVDLASWLLIVPGTTLCFIGALGMLRLPDYFCRIHAASMTDSLGAAMVLWALMLQAGWSLLTVKLLTVWLFLWLTSPASSHALAKAAFASGLRVATKEQKAMTSSSSDLP